MNKIEIREINSTISQVLSEDIQYIKHHLNSILNNSEETLIMNLIEETEFLLQQAKSDFKSYQERYSVFNQLTSSWLDIWNKFKDIPEAIDLLTRIDHLTNYSTAYSHLCLSLSLINENRTGEYEADLERIVSGFLRLSETVDVFADFFSITELKQIYDSSKNAIFSSDRKPSEYFEDGFKLAHLVTQLRAYSSLIVLKVEGYMRNIGLTLEDESIQLEDKVENNSSFYPWWEKIAGTFANDKDYDEAMRLGREYRNSLHSDSVELSDT